jgi:hypothetical protein
LWQAYRSSRRRTVACSGVERATKPGREQTRRVQHQIRVGQVHEPHDTHSIHVQRQRTAGGVQAPTGARLRPSPTCAQRKLPETLLRALNTQAQHNGNGAWESHAAPQTQPERRGLQMPQRQQRQRRHRQREQRRRTWRCLGCFFLAAVRISTFRLGTPGQVPVGSEPHCTVFFRPSTAMGNADSKAQLATDFARLRAVSVPDDDNVIWQHILELPSSTLVRGGRGRGPARGCGFLQAAALLPVALRAAMRGHVDVARSSHHA